VYRLIDTHVHLDELGNLEVVFNEAKENGVVAIVGVGLDYETNVNVLELSEKYTSFVYPALGLYPWQLARLGLLEVKKVEQFIEHNIEKAIAVGEIGLDYHKQLLKTVPKELQREVFRRLLVIAKRYNKPVIIHSRYSAKDAFLLVREAKIDKAVFHWFTGPSSVLDDIVSCGYYISATPAAAYHEEHRKAVKAVPVEQLILETDSPVTYGRDERYSAKPADIVRSLKAAAQLQGVEQAIIAEETTRNAMAFFNLGK